MRWLMTDAKVLDSKGKEVVKPLFHHDDAITDEDFIMILEDCHWLREVDRRRMFRTSMVRRYSIFNFQYESIVHNMSEKISAYQDRVAFRRIDR